MLSVKIIINIFILLSLIYGYHCLTPTEAVHRFFEYFKPENPLGIPVANFGEPLEIISPLETNPIALTNGKLYGHSQLKIEHINMDFLSLTGYMKMSAPKLIVVGEYSWPGFYDTSEGFMNATLVNVTIVSDITLLIDQDNVLNVANMSMNLTNEDVALNLTNLLWEHDLLLSTGVLHVFFADIAEELFRQLKPLFMDEANREIAKFIATLPPIERMLPSPDEDTRIKSLTTFLRRLVQYFGMDPLQLPDRDTDVLGMHFIVSDTILFGISNISRIESLYVIYEDKKIFVEAAMTYPTLFLFYKLRLKSGSVVDVDIMEKNQLNNVYVKIRIMIDPSLSTPPVISYLDIEIGSFGKIRSRENKSIWNRIADAFIKFKDLILREIVNALQGTIKKSVQKKLNDIDIENEIINLIGRKQNT